MSSVKQPPIAIVGICAELPSGSWSKSNLDYASFFDFLMKGGEAYERIPPDRFNIHTLKGTASGQVITDAGAFLKNIDLFDPIEFGITTKDAKLMNLGTRKLIETTFLALLDSGIDYRGQNIGCFMSAVAHDMFSISGHDDVEARGAFSYSPAMVANRVSYHLDLRGPTVPLDTACSSTLHATHLGIQALRLGECEAAVVGGCQLNHRFTEWLLYSQGGILSPDGKCKPFDATANGFGRGEAAVSIVLKPLDAALRDRDKIYATILGTGINSSGSLAPVNAPVASAQQDAMFRAFAQAHRSPQEVDFIELHATGTASGDPTEANWVGAQFKRDAELLVGSVKGNIGHTEITAFLSSLCKVCHMIEHGVIPPTVNFSIPNPAIKWTEHDMRVPVTPEKLLVRSPSGRALIAMSSSGIGGANGHCLIEAPPSKFNSAPCMWAYDGSMVPSLMIVGGLSPRSAAAIGESLKAITANQDCRRLGRALGRRARSMLWRAYAVAQDGQAFRFSEPLLDPKTAPEIVFVFSGQGPQHWNMGRELYKTCIPFRNTVMELDKVYAGVTGKSLVMDVGLFGEGDAVDTLGDVWPISITLPALTILQIALMDTLAAIGVKPEVVIGHSAGETAVLYASGAASKVMAVELSIARGRTMEALEMHDGAMAAMACSKGQAEEIIMEVIAELGPAVLEVGCLNAPNAITLSGSAEHVVSAVVRAKAAGILATRLRTRIPVHSSMMKVCQADYEEHVGEVFKKHAVGATKVKTFSTLTGRILSRTYDSDYFWKNTLEPVMFEPAIKAIRTIYPQAVFVELGPHPVLSAYIASATAQATTILSPLKRSKSADSGELRSFMESIGRLVCLGYSGIDMDMLYGTAESAGSGIPTYPFVRKPVAYVAPTFEITRQRQTRHGPLNYPQLQVNTQTHPGLADHIIQNEPIMPAAGFVEMALELGAKRLWDVQFHSILSLSSARPTPIEVRLQGSQWSVLSASAGDFTSTWPPTYNRMHATGYLSMDDELETDVPVVPLHDLRARLKRMEMATFYDKLASFANYGPTYRRVLSCYHGIDASGTEEFLVEIRGAGDDLDNLLEYRLHPAILDAALQIAVHPLITGAIAPGRYYLPSKIGAFIVHDTLTEGMPEKIYAHAVFVRWMPESLVYDFRLTNEDGQTLCTVEALEVAAHGRVPVIAQQRFEVVSRKLDINLSTPPNTSGIKEKSKKAVIIDVPSEHANTKLRIFHYRRGDEMKLQKEIGALNSSHRESICFVASEGTNGDAILGFSRSFRKEYRSWKVYCIVFHVSCPPSEYDGTAQSLCSHPLAEEEMSIALDGSVNVARVVPSSLPRRTVPFDPEALWTYQHTTLLQVAHLAAPSDHVLVRITASSSHISSCRAFMGRVSGSPVVYVGITLGPLANYVVAHRGSLLELDNIPDAASEGPDSFAAVTAVLAVGRARFGDPQRLEGSQILVTYSDTQLGRNILQIYRRRGLQVVGLTSQAQMSDIRAVLSRCPRFIVSGREQGINSHVDDAVNRLQPGKMFLWDDPTRGIARILAEDPWVIGDALKLALSDLANSKETFVPPIKLLSMPLPEEVQVRDTMFDPSKAYILVGGIGGLGLPVAYWMYQNGAREMILTSRSGATKLAAKDEFIALRILAFLKSKVDLVLRTEAVDASSIDQTRELVKSIQKPIGGCMIMTTNLADRMFAMQTPETFEASFTAKLGAFHVLAKCIDIDALDFVLAYSSIVGLSGNVGQTNYSSANTALTGLIRRYKNATAIVPPLVNDTGSSLTLAATDDISWSRYRHLISWAMTCEALCESIGEALLKLREGPLWQYIPSLDWGLIQRNLGPSPLYDHLVVEVVSSEVDQPASDDMDQRLSEVVCDVLDMAHEDLSPEVPLTSYGLDSLSATALSYALEPYLSVTQLQLLADMTLADLEQLRGEISSVTSVDPTSSRAEVPTIAFDNNTDKSTMLKAQEMVSMLQKYSADLPLRSITGRKDMKKNLLITGTTGSLGSHVLSHVLSCPSTEKVFAIVRPHVSGTSAMGRLLHVFKTRALDASALHSGKLVVLDGDVSEPRFGLSISTYNELLHSVTHIMHIAWTINFVAPLSAFEPHLRGTRYMIDFAASCNAHVQLLFCSTPGIFRRLPDRKPVAEVLIEDPSVAVESGYPESKWVAEHLVSLAADNGILSSTIVRVGQLCGSANGVWSTSEWIPTTVSTSTILGCLPDASGVISWLPLDDAAAAFVDCIDSPARVLHLRHPCPVAWSQVFKHFASILSIPLVPYAEWVALLEHQLVSGNAGVIHDHNLDQGLRLLHIYRLALDPNDPRPDITAKMTPYVTHGLEASTTLRGGKIAEIGEEHVCRWVEYWGKTGILSSDKHGCK